MNRRNFIAVLGSTLAGLPFFAHGQRPAVPVVGFLNSGSPSTFEPYLAAFRDSLAEAGYVEGRNLVIEYRHAEGNYDRLPILAADLVRNEATVIAVFSLPAALAAKAATTTTPIVVGTGADPVATGLVASFNRPGGNITGVSLLSPEMATKHVEFLRELVPKTSKIGVLVNPTNPIHASQLSHLRAGARTINMELLVLQASNERQIQEAFSDLHQRQADALIVTGDPFFQNQRTLLADLAARHSVPAIYESREFTAAGGLMNYGTSLVGVFRQLGNYTGRILNGAKPADLPVQLPTQFELNINLKTAKALGITIPQSILLRADEVIE